MKKNLPTTVPKQTIWNNYFPWILIFVSFFIYSNSLNNGYNMDDNLVTINHPITSKGISAFKEIFTTPYYTDELGNNYGYRPVSQLTFALEHSLFGENVKISHLINLLIYVSGIILLYQLLILLFHNTRHIYIFFACLLFAIHPVHTEVVNSLKNRDELLSFMFALLSCKYFIFSLKSEEKIKIGLSFIFILLAVLSKKSMYPIILIIPGIIALTQINSFKKLFVSTLIITIPVAIFSSEMQILRMIILTLIPLISLIFIYHVRPNYSKDSFINLHRYLLINIALICLDIFLYISSSFNLIFLFLSIPLFVWLFRLNYIMGIWILPLFLFYIGYINNEFWIELIGILIPLGYYSYHYLNNTLKNHYFFLYSVFLTLSSLIIHTEFVTLIILLNFLLFIWIFIKRKKYAVFYAILALLAFTISDFYSENNIESVKFIKYAYPLILFSTIILWNKYLKTLNKQWLKIIPSTSLFFILSLLVVQFFLVNHQYQSLDNVNQTVSTSNTNEVNKKTENKNIFKEGRMLTLIENPLVAPHTKTETIATGLYTLGHYARLLIYPKELSFYYGYSKIETQNFYSIWVWLSLIFYSGLIFLILYYFNKNWLISAGFAWYITCILLFSNWVELVAGVVGERLVFLASAGFFIGISGLLYEINIFNFNKNKYLKLSAVLLPILLLSNKTWNRNYDWKDTYTLMNKDIVHLENSAQANYLYANSVMRVGMNNQTLSPDQRMIFFQAGVNHFKQAVEIDSSFFNAQYDLARSYMYIKDTANAIKTFEICNQLSPNDTDVFSKLNFLKERFQNR